MRLRCSEPVSHKRRWGTQSASLKRHVGAPNATSVDKTRCEAHHALRTNRGYVIFDLLRNRIEKKHRLCNHWFIYHIPQIALGTNIGFVTSDRHATNCINWNGAEHWVCNLRIIYEILQKTHSETNIEFETLDFHQNISDIVLRMSIGCVTSDLIV